MEEKRKRLLVVVDYQKDFVDGSLSFDGAEKLDNKIAELIEEFYQEGDYIAFTFDTHYKDYLETQEGRKLPVVHCQYNTDGWELFGKTREVHDKIKYDEKRVVSYMKTTFGSDDLFGFIELKSEEVSEIHLVGLVSNICVLSNAVLAKTANQEAEIFIHSDKTASFDNSLNEKALDVMRGLQMTIL